MLQQISQIFMDIQIMSFRHLHHRIHYCTCLSPFGSITEQLVLSPQSKRTDHILAQIIGKTASTIFQIGHEQFFVILGIVTAFSNVFLSWESAVRSMSKKHPAQMFLFGFGIPFVAGMYAHSP